MTTPKKAKYHLRNRTVLVPMSGGVPGGPPESPENGLEMSVAQSEEDLLSETMPQEMLEEKTEALTEEIRKLQVCRLNVYILKIYGFYFIKALDFFCKLKYCSK